MKIEIRKAKPEEAEATIDINIAVWKTTYKDLIPMEIIEKLQVKDKERIKSKEDRIREKQNTIVALVDGKIFGYHSIASARNVEYENCGEIFALYIIGKYKGNGFGKMLVEQAKKELKILGFDKIIIACLKGNPSNEFYKHIGGIYVKDGVYKRLNLPENIYYFENII